MTAAASSGRVKVEVEGRHLTLSSLDRVLWPETGFTKAQMIDYYRAVAPAMLPHLRNRPVTLVRFPEGVDRDGWYQTNCRGHPPWMSVHEVRSRRGDLLRYCVVNDLPSVVWAANLGTIEFHPLLSTTAGMEESGFVIFDLDPGPPASVRECARVALHLRDELEKEGLTGFPKTSGAKGLHVHVPVGPPWAFDRAKGFARQIAERLAAGDPEMTLSEQARDRRAGKVLVDWGQNDPNRSVIAPYSLRAMREPRVAGPLRWAEVESIAAGGEPPPLGPGDVLDRLARAGDAFADMVKA
ncbi:MAG TPA: non-homologous end-joining DNA ligase [Actinomycetota bacterium]|nr:non-homologous end-joining DNA ligase [Actinomycetota bacterium]